jgi:PHP family Zn ribbon phosphoesterase
VTAGVGAYKQKKLPEEIFRVIEQCIVSGGSSVVVRNAGAELAGGKVVCPACKTQCDAGAKFCNNCGAPLNHSCPKCGAQVKPGSKFCSECGQPL